MGSNRDENFCLRWNDFESNLSTAFMELRNDADMCDVTIATDEDSVAAHKLVLSACSPQLKEMIRKHIRLSGSSGQQNILIYLRGVRHADLVSVLEFMYCGSVNVAQEDLNSFLAVAEDLKVKGLTQNSNGKDQKRAGPASSKRSLTPSGTPGGGGGGGGGTPGPSSAKKFRPAPSSASTSSSSAAQAASTSTPSDHHQSSSSSKLVKQEHKEHDDHEQDTLGGGDQDDTFGDDSHQGGTEDYGGYDDGAADDGLGFDGDESGAGPSDIGKGQSSRLPLLPGTRGGGGFPVGVFNTQQFAANNPTAAQIRDEYVVDLTDQPGSRCKICNKEFVCKEPATAKYNAALHVLCVHLEAEDEFCCPYCQAVLNSRHTLKKHFVRKHQIPAGSVWQYHQYKRPKNLGDQEASNPLEVVLEEEAAGAW